MCEEEVCATPEQSEVEYFVLHCFIPAVRELDIASLESTQSAIRITVLLLLLRLSQPHIRMHRASNYLVFICHASNLNRGYNYVQCLENVVWSNNFRADTSQCWKMTTFCRNIMITPGMDELGHGNTPGAFADFGGGGGVAAIVVLVMALIAGALSTFAIITALRGGFSKKLTRFQTAEFTRVATEAYEDQVVL